MGAHDYVITIEESDRAKVKDRWERQVEDDGDESGNGAYAGNATTMHGHITFHDERLSDEAKAREFILDHHQKWTGPLAVSFALPIKDTAHDQERQKKAIEQYEEVEGRQYACLHGIVQAFIGRKAGLIGCKGCDSRLSHEHLVKRLDPGRDPTPAVGGSARWTVNGRPRTRNFQLPTLPGCPVCCSSLLSETDQKLIAGHAEKVKVALVAFDEELKSKPSDKIGWVVGGWAAS